MVGQCGALREDEYECNANTNTNTNTNANAPRPSTRNKKYTRPVPRPALPGQSLLQCGDLSPLLCLVPLKGGYLGHLGLQALLQFGYFLPLGLVAHQTAVQLLSHPLVPGLVLAARADHPQPGHAVAVGALQRLQSSHLQPDVVQFPLQPGPLPGLSLPLPPLQPELGSQLRDLGLQPDRVLSGACSEES